LSQSKDIEAHYEALGVSGGATLREAKSRARRLFMKYHPDLNPGNRIECEEKIKALLESYREVIAHIRDSGGEVRVEIDEADGEKELDSGTEVLVFEVSNRRLAIPLSRVREILRLQEVRLESSEMLSGENPFISGLFRRGEETAVLWNLHLQFRLREPPIGSGVGRNKIIIVEHRNSIAGFMVDEVEGIATVMPGDIDTPSDGAGIDDVFLEGEARLPNGPAGLINLKNILYNCTP